MTPARSLLLAACLAPAAAVFGAFWLLPMVRLVMLPASKGWETYAAVLTHPRYFQSLANTLGLSVAVTLATLVIGAAVGLFLARTRFVGRRLLLSLLTLPLSFPGVIVGFFVIPIVGLFVGFPIGVYVAEYARVVREQAWPSTWAAIKAVTDDANDASGGDFQANLRRAARSAAV